MRKLIYMVFIGIVILGSLVGCASTETSSNSNVELPEGVENVEFYEDMVGVLDMIKTDCENKTFSHTLEYDIAKNDPFLKNLTKYEDKKLTSTEEKIRLKVWDLLISYNDYMNIVSKADLFTEDGTINVNIVTGKSLYKEVVEFSQMLNVPIE